MCSLPADVQIQGVNITNGDLKTFQNILSIYLCVREHQGPVSERRLSENSEYVNPEMRETLRFTFQNGRFVKPGKAG